MAVARLDTNAEGHDQTALADRETGQRLPGEHDPLPRDRRVEHQRRLVERVAHAHLGAGKADFAKPHLPAEHRVTVNHGREL